MTGLLHRLPPAWTGYRRVRSESLEQHAARLARHGVHLERCHEPAVAQHSLPRNVSHPDELPDDRGWWGYSFRDVPSRRSGPTLVLRIRHATVTWYRDPARSDDFYPAILARDGTALEHRELKFRPLHAATLRGRPSVRLECATWVIERVFHNYSHWLTAHLPKLLFLAGRGYALEQVLLPAVTPAFVHASMQATGLRPERFGTFGEPPPLEVDHLTVVGTDRFRPELLRLVSHAAGADASSPGHRRLFISRDRATRRRLVNEAEVWPLFAEAGFERVTMETLTFADQVALMREARVVAGLHGAGLTNMMFAPTGAEVVEIADFGFPNPNFYALAAALGHSYWVVGGQAAGDGHPVDRDVYVPPEAVRRVLSRLPG